MNNKGSYTKSSKSFYIVLSIALAAIVASTIVITYTSRKISSNKSRTSYQSSDVLSVPQESENVDIPKDDVPDTREEKTTKAKSKKEKKTESQAEETTTSTTGTTQAETTKKSVSCCLPVGTQILKDYSNGTMVKSKTMNDWRLHNGVDFLGETGDEIHSVTDGKVVEISSDSMWGKVVVIDHADGMKAKYCGFDEVNVKEGDTVKKEQVIGTLGSIPIESADNTHLHLEITVDGKITDPLSALGRDNGGE